MTDIQNKTLLTALKQTGVFVTAGLNPPNVMTTHWGALGTLWNKPVFILPVRPGKLSHELIEKEKEFALSVPVKDMRNEIVQCDHLSGYSVNKFEELHLHPKRAKSISAYVLGECGLIAECKVLFSADMTRNQLHPDLYADMYADKEYHTMYFGEIVNVYDLSQPAGRR